MNNRSKGDLYIITLVKGLIETLNFLATKNLWISGWIVVHESSEQNKIIFEEAVLILKEKFSGKHNMSGRQTKRFIFGKI